MFLNLCLRPCLWLLTKDIHKSQVQQPKHSGRTNRPDSGKNHPEARERPRPAEHIGRVS